VGGWRQSLNPNASNEKGIRVPFQLGVPKGGWAAPAVAPFPQADTNSYNLDLEETAFGEAEEKESRRVDRGPFKNCRANR